MLNHHDCRDELRQADLKATPARLAVLHYMEKEHRPLDVEEILLYLEQSHLEIDQATVYRILDKFHKSALIDRLEFQEGKFRYEIQHNDDHHHLICKSCGKIEDISDCNSGVLEKEIERKKGFKVTSHSLEFFGICQTCQR